MPFISRRRYLEVFAVAGTLLFVGVGCGDSPSGEATASPATGNTASANKKSLTIAVIPKGLTHVFWQSVKAGAEKAGAEGGATIQWDGPQKETDTNAQIGIVENAINSKVDGIVLAPLDKAALVTVIKKAKTSGVPLTIFDSAADVTEDQYVSFVATDNKKGGQMAAERMGEQLGGKGKVALIPVQPNSASTMDRESGFEETIRSQFPGITVIRSNYSMNDRTTALKVVEDVLTANPDIVGIFGPNEPSAIGALQAIKNRNLVGKVKIIGFDHTRQLEEAMDKSELDSLILQNPFKMGYEGVKTILDVKAGNTPAKTVDTGVVLVTKDNKTSPEVQAVLK